MGFDCLQMEAIGGVLLITGTVSHSWIVTVCREAIVVILLIYRF